MAETYVRRKGTIRAHPKDGDERVIPLSSKAIEIIKRRIEGRDMTKGCGVVHTDGTVCTNELIFRNVWGGVLHQDLLSSHIRQSGIAANLTPKSGYALRRGFATRAIEGGMDSFSAKRIMGHSDLEELEGYVQETPAARARMLASLGERPQLAAVDESVGQRGTDSTNQPPSTVTNEDETNAGDLR
ncbi:MAG: xerC [Amycolatopsis sp.]|nr:xerC [Amycolatopsis sp.]